MLLNFVLVVTVMAAAEPPLPPPPHRTSFAAFASDRVEDCVRDAHRQPKALLPYARLLRLAMLPASRTEALSSLERLAASRATTSRAQLYLGIARLKLGDRVEAEKVLRVAVERLRNEGEDVGETYGRLYLELARRLDGRLDEATPELRRAQELAARVGDPILTAEVEVFEGWEDFFRHDHGRALTLFESARDVLVQGPSGFVESLAWEGIAAAQIELYRHREALDAEKARIRAVERDRGTTAWARASLANRAFYMADEGPLSFEEVDTLIAEAVDDANREQNAPALRSANQLRALRLGTTPEAERLLEWLREQGGAAPALATWELGRLRGRLYPERQGEAEALLTEAHRVAAARGLDYQMSVALLSRALLRWERGNEAGARLDTEESLRLQERALDQQFEDSARVGTGSRGFFVYVDTSNPFFDRGHFREAFDITERMRARSLLEAVRGHRRGSEIDASLQRRRAALRTRIAGLQSELLSSSLSSLDRQTRKEELSRAEIEERQLEDEIGRTSAPRGGKAERLHLEDVQRRLGPDGALLSYVVAPEGHADRGDFVIGPRSFLLVVTSRDVRGIRIPDRDQLGAELAMFLAGIEGRKGLEATGASALHAQLVGEALAGLDPAVRRLIILPSGPLHALPFELLQPSPDSPPLGERFAITRAPSATVWGLLRDEPMATGREPLMALADPGALSADRPALRRAAPWIEGVRLGALPFARVEAEEAVRALGSGSRLLAGADASEHALKTLPLKRWSALHVAAHAVVDEEFPERSAVVLAPGASGEDGLLQTRDITELDLDGMLVVLAACRSASGRPSNSEGPVGLARAFLQAGARAVVVSLWELEDAASRRLFEHFYERLARGDSVQEALRSARAARIRAGDVSADWAGLVVVGDGDLRLPAGPRSRGWVPLLVACAAAVLTVLGAALRRRLPRLGTAR